VVVLIDRELEDDIHGFRKQPVEAMDRVFSLTFFSISFR
jgi:hypothetical protein